MTRLENKVCYLIFQGFGNILNLVPIAEHVTKLTAVCMNCYSEASFTKRKGSEKKVCVCIRVGSNQMEMQSFDILCSIFNMAFVPTHYYFKLLLLLSIYFWF